MAVTRAMRGRSAVAQAVRHRLWPAAPGLLIACTIALASREFAGWVAVPPLVVALGLGMLFAGLVDVDRATPGVTMATRPVLRTGVALLGAQIGFQQLAGLGAPVVAIALAGLVAALAAGIFAGRMAGLSKGVAAVAAGAVAICGASAAFALAAVVPKKQCSDEETAAIVAAATILGTLAMLAYPLIAVGLGFSAQATAVFLGATLHEVAQAVGAGMAVSLEVGTLATAVKLLRVACLTPVVILVGLLLRERADAAAAAAPPLVPPFLVIFFLLAAAASFGLVPPLLREALSEVSRFCLLVAIAALGMKTSLNRMLGAGKPLILTMLFTSLLLAAIVGTALFVLS